MGSWELLGIELVLVVVMAILSMSEAALHAIRRPALVEELIVRGRRGQRAGRMGERRGHWSRSCSDASCLARSG